MSDRGDEGTRSPTPAPREHAGNTARAFGQQRPPERQAISIVIAEDHTVVREGTRRILEQTADLEVVGEAADGRETIDVVDRLRPDVVIVDIAMPGMNGIEATRHIKAKQPSTCVLVLTAYDDDQYVFALLKAGAAGYLMKDVRGSELVEAIRAVHRGEPVLHPAIERKVLRHFAHPAPVAQPVGGLSDREVEVLALAARGLGNKEIGTALGVSVRTVQAHFTHIFTKLGVASRTEAVIFGLRQGWLDLEGSDASEH